MKYDFLIKNYFQILKNLLNSVITSEDTSFQDIIEIIMEFLGEMFEEGDYTDDEIQNISDQLLQKVTPLFFYVIK